MSQSVTLAIGEISVRQLNGLFSLNDLHKAAGNENRHAPNRFLRIANTQALVDELGACPEMGTPLKVVNDGENNGTYACRELVIAYAAWISAAFHLKVIRVFLSAVHNPAIASDRISASQAQDLKELVNAIVKTGTQGYPDTWGRFQAKFRVNSYLELPAAKFDEARQYLLGKLPAGQQPVVLSMDSINAANEAASAAAAQVHAAVFKAMLQGSGDWMHQRHVIGFDTSRPGQAPQAAVRQLEWNDCILQYLNLPKLLAASDNRVSSPLLADIANACLQRLAGRTVPLAV